MCSQESNNQKMQKRLKKPFIMVEFTNYSKDNETADIDVVPSEWIYYDEKENTCKTPYPDPPYNEYMCKLLHTRVKNLLPPLSSWPNWPIIIKGSAKDYKTAESRLQKLKKEAFAFSTDVEGSNSVNKAEKYTKEYRKIALQKLSQVPGIGENSQQNQKDNDILFEYTSSDSSSSNTEISKKKICKKSAKKKQTSPTYCTKKKKSCSRPVLKNSTDVTSKADKRNDIANAQQDPLLLMQDEQLLDYAKKLEKSLTREMTNNEEETSEHKEEQIVLNNKSTKKNAKQTVILNAITKIRFSIKNIQQDVHLMKNKLFGYEIGKLEAALKQHKLDIPFNDFDAWAQFQILIEMDKTINDSFVTTIELCLDKVSNNPTKSITNILKKIMTRELATQFTAIKKSTNKENIFKDQKAYLPIKKVIMNCHCDSNGKPITEQAFHVSLSAAFGNAKDWGGRVKNNGNQ
ncbi:uncharacterized protein [Temnothorax longispinosus]|uniref:uncharacterized protein isoform X3 n=1 Tax=Temnothorax longispinosus TaxID=300112 RepID=UPI003A99E035